MAIELDQRAKENQELFRRWRDARADWDTDARTDIDFFHGNHFTKSESEDLQSRNPVSYTHLTLPTILRV